MNITTETIGQNKHGEDKTNYHRKFGQNFFFKNTYARKNYFGKLFLEKYFGQNNFFRKKVSNCCCEYALISMDNIISDVSCTLGGGLCV